MTSPFTVLRTVLTQWAKTAIVLCTDGGANDGKGVEVTGTSDGSVNVNLTGGAVGGQTVAQGDPNAGGAAAWWAQIRPSTPYSSAALEPSAVLKNAAGTFRSLTVMLDATAPTGTYYAQLGTASATIPANGAVTLLRPPQTINHINGTADYAIFDEGDSGITFTVGCWACISSTQFAKTVSGSYATFAGSVL
jgi:hypothetical protein